MNAVAVTPAHAVRPLVLLAVLTGCSGAPDVAAFRIAPWYATPDSTASWNVDEDPSLCSTCLVIEREAVMGDSTVEGLVVETHEISQDSTGRYWVGQRERIKVFSPTGQWVKTIGRPGRGPFEFVLAKPLHTDAKRRVHVIDPGNAREMVYGDDFSPQWERRIPAGDPFDVVAIGDGEGYVMNMWLQSETGAGLLFHRVRNGDVEQSFGAQADGKPASPFTSQRHLAVDTGGRLFASQRFAFDIDARNPSGDLIIRLVGPVLNEKPVGPGVYDPTDNPLPNEITDIRVDRHARLWILSRRVRSNWNSFMTQRVYPNGMVGLVLKPGATVDSLAYTRLEVVDLQKRRIVARRDHPGNLTDFIGDEQLLQNWTDESGIPRVVVWRIKARFP